MLTYNTELMAKAGLDPNSPPKSIMQMLDMSAQIAKNSGGNYTAFLANPRFRLIGEWLAMGAKVISDDNKKFVFADDPKVQQWLAKYKELYQAGAMPKDSLATDDTDPSARYSEGKLVFGSTNASFLRYIRDNAPSVYPKTTVAPYPTENGVRYEGQYIAVPVTSKNPATAAAFAQFLLNAENQTKWCQHPKVVIFPTSAASLSDPFFTKPSDDSGAFGKARQVAATAANGAKADALMAIWNGSFGGPVTAEIQLAMKGDKDPAQALKDAQEKANAVLAQVK